MPVRKPIKLLPPELQELINSHPQALGRSLRQVLEQDGLTDEVLRIGPTTLGFLIDQLEGIEQIKMQAAVLSTSRPDVLFDVQVRSDQQLASTLATFDPWDKRLQEVADRRFDGAKLSVEILRRMRGEICREHDLRILEVNALPLPVAVELLIWGETPLAKPLTSPPDPSPPTRKPLKQPSANAIAAYRVVKFGGKTETDAAPMFGVVQSTICRWVQAVAKWVEAGNILPDELTALPPRPKKTTMDPRKLDRGPRRRGRA